MFSLFGELRNVLPKVLDANDLCLHGYTKKVHIKCTLVMFTCQKLSLKILFDTMFFDFLNIEQCLITFASLTLLYVMVSNHQDIQ